MLFVLVFHEMNVPVFFGACFPPPPPCWGSPCGVLLNSTSNKGSHVHPSPWIAGEGPASLSFLSAQDVCGDPATRVAPSKEATSN